MEPEIIKSYWEWVMFDSTTGVTHSVVCHNCRKPREPSAKDICIHCGALMEDKKRRDNIK